MRRPAQPRTTRTVTGHGWAHPYTGISGLAVFYNDGGDPPAPAPTDPPKPGPPPGPAKEFTQEDLDRIAAREKAQGKRSALKEFAEELGFTSAEDTAAFVAAARQIEEAKKTDEQKRQEELDRREQELAAREASAVARERSANRRAVLVGLGATGDDLEDAAALLRVADDADDQAVREAAEALKGRRPELFGAQRAPQTPPALPPAPGGAPAGGGHRQPASRDDVKARMEKRAEQMGFRRTA
ncbi:hypothetical protein ACFV0T_26145 [Streptomyces sp. NPDC059582]|uniref:hypothetical protein n=1 Tax=Streptomyces sp. NPDC059582 TaxID=3346875 RepID=UPI00369D0BF6